MLENGGSRPVPDPTKLTSALVEKAIETERLLNKANSEVLVERLDSIDKATELLAKNVEFVHADLVQDIETAVIGAVAVINQKFEGVAQRIAKTDREDEANAGEQV